MQEPAFADGAGRQRGDAVRQRHCRIPRWNCAPPCSHCCFRPPASPRIRPRRPASRLRRCWPACSTMPAIFPRGWSAKTRRRARPLDGQRLLTRATAIRSTRRWFTAGWLAQAMDGELWIARGEFPSESATWCARCEPTTTHGSRSASWPSTCPGDAGRFAQRASRLRELVVRTNAPQLGAIAQTHVGDRATLDACAAAYRRRRRRRRAGAASRDGALPGRAQRRPARHKPADDAEARVVGYRPGKGKYAGMVGALLVVDASGRRFALGRPVRRATPEPAATRHLGHVPLQRPDREGQSALRPLPARARGITGRRAIDHPGLRYRCTKRSVLPRIDGSNTGLPRSSPGLRR